MSASLSESTQLRFGGIIRLYGTRALARLQHSHVLIIGLGGVGSWTAEALARSGIGQLTLMDMDDICITNTNRQVHTQTDTVGQPKTTVMAERLQAINPELTLHCIDDFIDKHNIAEHVDSRFDIVIDAIDSAIDKTELVAYCVQHTIPVISAGSSGGKQDPSKITYGDLKKTTGDALFSRMRNNLRRYHGFSRDPKKNFGVEVIYSTEQTTYPDGDGETCQTKGTVGSGEKLDCSSGYGAAMMVTASFGLLLASRAIEKLITGTKS